MKTKVAVLFGGVSSEHEVSLRSAASVIRHLDRDRFEIIPIGITKQGDWLLYDVDHLCYDENDAIIINPNTSRLSLSPSDEAKHLFDVVFPVVHGSVCEDGSLQGFLRILDVPFVGPDVLGSAVAMDKVVTKQLAKFNNIPVSHFCSVRQAEWLSEPKAVTEKITSQFDFPLFIKPANAGSSIGISKAKKQSDLKKMLDLAFEYDDKVVVEQAVNGREIEISILESRNSAEPPLTSIPGEIIPTHEFYDYDAKYLDPNGAKLCIPAELTPRMVSKIKNLAIKVFDALSLNSMARVDFFLEHDSGKVYFNEANTLPGFTSISMYPQLWQVSGLAYADLLTHLVELAILRHERRSVLKTERCEEA